MSKRWWSPVWMRVRAQMRSRRLSTAVLAVLIGLAGTVVLTAEAGARRTDSAYRNYLSATHAPDYLVSASRSGDNRLYGRIAALPQVEQAGIGAGPPLVSLTRGTVDQDVEDYVQTLASEDGSIGYRVGRLKLISGRMPDPNRPLQAVANVALAARRHLRVGSTFTMYLLPPSAVQSGAIPPVAQLRPLTFTVTGIGVSADEVVPIAPNDGLPTLLLTPAFHRAYDHGPDINFDGAYVRLRPGADRSAFIATVDRLSRDPAGAQEGGIFVADLAVHYGRVERAIHPEAVALELFAGLVALAGLVAVGQIIFREVAFSAAEDPVLRALGFDRLQTAAVPVIRVGAAAFAGSVLAVAGSVLASPLMPIGPARLAEPHPGISVDGAVLGAGFGILAAAFLTVCSAAAWRATRPAGTRDRLRVRRPSRLVEALGRAGVRPPAVTGIRMALEPGQGRSAVPVRSATGGIVVSVAALVAVLTFSANLHRLVSTPRLYGDTWSVALDAQFNSISRADITRSIATVPGIGSLAGGNYGDDVTIDGQKVPTVGIDPIEGSLYPTIVSGRAPVGRGEIALGQSTLRRLHRRIGESVTLRYQGRSIALRIVGQVVLPSFGRGSFTPTDLGEGAVTAAAVVAQPPAGNDSYNFVLVGFSSSAHAAAAMAGVARIAHDGGCPGDQCLLTTSRVLPTDVRSYDRVSSTPVLLAVLIALLGIAMIAHALATFLRRRRRDLAVLKTLGFVKGEVARSVAWQVSTFAAIGLAAGVPIGAAGGRWLWSLFAHQIGVPASSGVPLVVLAVIPSVLLVVNAIGALPARSAARTRPALVLRSE